MARKSKIYSFQLALIQIHTCAPEMYKKIDLSEPNISNIGLVASATYTQAQWTCLFRLPIYGGISSIRLQLKISLLEAKNHVDFQRGHREEQQCGDRMIGCFGTIFPKFSSGTQSTQTLFSKLARIFSSTQAGFALAISHLNELRSTRAQRVSFNT